MFRKLSHFVALVVVLGALIIPAMLIRAQGNNNPASLADAIVDLGKRLNKSLTLDSFNNATSKWSWVNHIFTDTSLECPQSGKAATPASIPGYQILLIYLGQVYDYRATQADRTSLFLCVGSNGVSLNGQGTTVPSVVNGTPGAVATSVTGEALGAPLACPAANLPTRLTIGKQGQVLPGLPNNLRSDGNFSASIISQIPAGGTFQVLDGPKCDRGFRYWKVSFNGLIGWTAEGLTVYYVQPI